MACHYLIQVAPAHGQHNRKWLFGLIAHQNNKYGSTITVGLEALLTGWKSFQPENFTRFQSDNLESLITVWIYPTMSKLQILYLEWRGEVQRGMLPNVFIKVKRMLEKVIHEEGTRYIIVESLRAGINKRKTASAATPQVVSCNTQFGRKAITDTNLVETLQWLLQSDQE